MEKGGVLLEFDGLFNKRSGWEKKKERKGKEKERKKKKEKRKKKENQEDKKENQEEKKENQEDKKEKEKDEQDKEPQKLKAEEDKKDHHHDADNKMDGNKMDEETHEEETKKQPPHLVSQPSEHLMVNMQKKSIKKVFRSSTFLHSFLLLAVYLATLSKNRKTKRIQRNLVALWFCSSSLLEDGFGSSLSLLFN